MAKDKWISFEEGEPPQSGDLVLGCDWYLGEYRVHVCESEANPKFWCGEVCSLFTLVVSNSCCPPIGNGESPYWMELDSVKKWNTHFTFPEEEKIIIQAPTDNLYVGGVVGGCSFSPDFNMFKSINSECIKRWRILPPPPSFRSSPPLTSEELKRKREQEKGFMEKIREA